MEYRLTLDEELQEVRVRVCLNRRAGGIGSAPGGSAWPSGMPALIPGIAGGVRHLRWARDDNGRALEVGASGIRFTSESTRCVHYAVDLSSALASSRFASRFGASLLSSAGLWLWRPPGSSPPSATLRFEGPPGWALRASWPQEDGVYLLAPSAFRLASFVALGRFESRRMQLSGVDLEVSRLGEDWTLSWPMIEIWLRQAFAGISQVQGRFPVDKLSIFLTPTSGDQLRFGMVRRGGGPAVAFVVGRRSTDAQLLDSWVTWHELSHLQLPALPQRDAWLYEGLATYYQEVLPARLGRHTPDHAWRTFLEGFSRGENGRPRGRQSLAEASADLMRSSAFTRVYWAGTAFALEADVSLRRQGSSLDQALASAAPRWRDTPSDLWSSARVCALLDGPLDGSRTARNTLPTESILGALRRRYTRQQGFPTVGPLLTRLGVASTPEGVRLSDAPLSAIREAIMGSDSH